MIKLYRRRSCLEENLFRDYKSMEHGNEQEIAILTGKEFPQPWEYNERALGHQNRKDISISHLLPSQAKGMDQHCTMAHASVAAQSQAWTFQYPTKNLKLYLIYPLPKPLNMRWESHRLDGKSSWQLDMVEHRGGVHRWEEGEGNVSPLNRRRIDSRSGLCGKK